MSDPVQTLQRHVFETLATNTSLGGLSCEVFDHVPEAAVCPYVVLGEFDQLPDDEHTNTGALVTLTMHAWSRYRGYREAARCLDAVTLALHRTRPVLEGWADVSILHNGNQYQRDPDPGLRHGIGRFTARFSGPTAPAQ